MVQIIALSVAVFAIVSALFYLFWNQQNRRFLIVIDALAVLKSEILLKENENITLKSELEQKDELASMTKNEMDAFIAQMGRYRLMVEDTDQFFFELNTKGQIIYANHALLKYLGYSKDEIIRYSFQDFISKPQYQVLTRFYASQIKNIEIDSLVDWEIMNRFGESMWVEIHIRLIYDLFGRIIFFRGRGNVIISQIELKNHKKSEADLFKSLLLNYQNPVLLFDNSTNTDICTARLEWMNVKASQIVLPNFILRSGALLSDISPNFCKIVQQSLSFPNENSIWQPSEFFNFCFRIMALHSDGFLVLFLSATKILKNKKIAIGPEGHNDFGFITTVCENYGAEIKPFGSFEELSDLVITDNYDLVVWLSSKNESIIDLHCQFLEKYNLKLLVFTDQKIKSVSLTECESVFTRAISTNPNDILKEIEPLLGKINSTSEMSVSTENVIQINFSRLMEITDGNIEFTTKLLATYCNSLLECRTSFEKNLNANDVEGLIFLLHKIRATINTFEIEALDNLLEKAISMLKSEHNISSHQKRNLIRQVGLVIASVEDQISMYATENQIVLKKT
jgi:PAS domain S-box-containing protein